MEVSCRLKKILEKIKKYPLALGLNFLLLLVTVMMYPVDKEGVIIDNTTKVPAIMFILGCYIFPWYSINKHKFTKKLHKAVITLFTGSYLFMWLMMFITGSIYSQGAEFISFFGAVVTPIALYQFFKKKWGFVEEKGKAVVPKKEPVKKEVQKKVETPEKKEPVPQSPYSLLEITNLIRKVKDPEVKAKSLAVQETLQKVVGIVDKLDVEEKHIVKKLITNDFKKLLTAYLNLSKEKKDEAENEVIENLDIIDRFLCSLLEEVSKEDMKTMRASMKLIEERYQR